MHARPAPEGDHKRQCHQSARQVEAIIQSEKLTQKMHSNSSDNVSVDALRKTKLGRGRGCGQQGGHGRGRGQGGSQGGYHQRTPSRYRNQSSDR